MVSVNKGLPGIERQKPWDVPGITQEVPLILSNNWE